MKNAPAGDLIPPIVHRQQIVLGNFHSNQPFLFYGKYHYLIKGVPKNGLCSVPPPVK